MPLNVAELAHRLAREAEAVRRHYLPNGRRVGNYWQVGDVRNTTGRSMFVRLKGGDTGKRPAGKWTDAATGEHGDLLDVIKKVAAWPISTMSLRRHVGSSVCHDPNRNRTIHRAGHQCRPARRNRHGVCLPCQSRLPEQSWKPICGDAASLTCMVSTAYDSIHAATIVPWQTRRLKPGPQ
jgi:hypothetical protein